MEAVREAQSLELPQKFYWGHRRQSKACYLDLQMVVSEFLHSLKLFLLLAPKDQY